MQIKNLTFMSIAQTIAGAAMLACFLAAPGLAEEAKGGDLAITQAWIRATPGGAKIGSAYLTIENKGSAPDRLIGGAPDVGATPQGHSLTATTSVLRMRS